MTEKRSKILVVDDDPGIIDFISDVLVDANYEVFAANNGVSALSVVLKVLPDLIIMDWEMPKQNGIETVAELNKNVDTRNIPVIMITGRMTSVKNLKMAFDAGVIDFIRKPIEKVELIARTKSMLLLAKYHNEIIRNKNWELTLLSKNNYQTLTLLGDLTRIIEKNCIAPADKSSEKYSEVKDAVGKIKSNIHNSSWNQFEEYFKSVHPNFSKNLLAAFPGISSEELRMCHFLRLNMTTKEIASLTNKENHSIDISRYRLRKKLKLERAVKLHEFLLKF